VPYINKSLIKNAMQNPIVEKNYATMQRQLNTKENYPGALLDAANNPIPKPRTKYKTKVVEKLIYIKENPMKKTKPQGKGIVKALGQKKTTGNFKKIAAAKGKGAAIGALQNKLAKRRGLPIPYGRKKK
jgi:hypothetical protein